MLHKNCTNQPKQFYIGASGRKAAKRLKDHEHAIRHFNKRTTPGEHMLLKHPTLKPRRIENKVNIPNMLKHFNIEVIKRCKDPLDTYLSEAVTIIKEVPNMNNMMGNGFIR